MTRPERNVPCSSCRAVAPSLPPRRWWAAARRKSRRHPRPRRAGTGGRARRAAPKPAPLKIAFAYVGPVGDGGWTFAHDNGRKAVEKEFGDKVADQLRREACPRRPTPSACSATWSARATS